MGRGEGGVNEGDASEMTGRRAHERRAGKKQQRGAGAAKRGGRRARTRRAPVAATSTASARAKYAHRARARAASTDSIARLLWPDAGPGSRLLLWDAAGAKTAASLRLF